MPTYDYECQDCGHRFELFQSITAPVKRKCPECGERALERLIGTGAAVLFKGDGFYSTDYRSKSYRDAAKADESAAQDKTRSRDETGAAEKADAGNGDPAPGADGATVAPGSGPERKAGGRARKKSAKRTP